MTKQNVSKTANRSWNQGIFGTPTKVATRFVWDCARQLSFVKNWTARTSTSSGVSVVYLVTTRSAIWVDSSLVEVDFLRTKMDHAFRLPQDGDDLIDGLPQRDCWRLIRRRRWVRNRLVRWPSFTRQVFQTELRFKGGLFCGVSIEPLSRAEFDIARAVLQCQTAGEHNQVNSSHLPRTTILINIRNLSGGKRNPTRNRLFHPGLNTGGRNRFVAGNRQTAHRKRMLGVLVAN